MTIVKSEMLALNDNEKKAIDLVIRICEGVDKEAEDPDLRYLADRILDDLQSLRSIFVENA